MKQYNYINNLYKSFRKRWLIGIDQDRSALNTFINLIYYIFNRKTLTTYLFVRLSIRGKLILVTFYFIAFILLPLGFILVLFGLVLIGLKLFG